MTNRSYIAGWAFVAIGFAVIGAGWAGVQSTPVVAVQLAYVASGSITGIAFVLVGTALQRQGETQEMREILVELRDRFDDLEHDVAELVKAVDSLSTGAVVDVVDASQPRPRSRRRAS